MTARLVVETPELEAFATAEQRLRFWVDPWTERIEEWLGNITDVSMPEVLEGALGLAVPAQSRTVQMRVAGILTHLGFTKSGRSAMASVTYRYVRPKS